MRVIRILSLLFLAGLAGGCVNFKTVQGVNSPWSEDAETSWERGVTTQSVVLDALGPPSQIIALHDGSVLYYLRERGAGSAQIFVVINKANLEVEYDRVVFFFDSEGILTDYAYSKE